MSITTTTNKKLQGTRKSTERSLSSNKQSKKTVQKNYNWTFWGNDESPLKTNLRKRKKVLEISWRSNLKKRKGLRIENGRKSGKRRTWWTRISVSCWRKESHLGIRKRTGGSWIVRGMLWWGRIGKGRKRSLRGEVVEEWCRRKKRITKTSSIS